MSKLTGLSMTALFISSTALFPLQSEAATRRRSSPPKSQTAAKVESSSAEKPRKMTIGRLEAHEGAKHFYLKVGCSEEKPELSTTKKPANQDESDGGNPDESSGESSGEYAENSYERNSRLKNCKVSEDFVERITVSPKTRISVTDEKEGGFRIIGLFKKGKYTVKIAKGAQSKTGAVLDDSFDEEVEVPARQPKVRFTSSGRYLPRKNLKSLSVNSVNAKKLKVEVHHIREDNILAWLREFSENSTSGIADKIGSKTIDISAKEDENSVSFIDLSAITGQPQKGVYQIKASVTEKFGSEGILNRIAFWENDENERADARADEVSESVGKGDVRYIMLTDLNLVAKRQNGNDKYLVTVLDAHSGAPLKGASVRAVTKTGKLISECKTSETGCELPATDSTAFALIATHADDLTYLRFSDLRMQIIDEDTNGPEFASKSPYKAALYGDRDIYRPSETVRIVSVVRDQDNSAPPAGMPVTVNVLDSRGRQIKNFTQKLNSAGIFENELLLDPSAATGTYKAELLIAKKQVQTMDFKVEEFAPERIRIVGGYNKESYLSRESPKLKFKAEYLFGGTAAGSPFEAICELEPALFKPPQNSDFHFGIWRPDTDGKQRRVISLGSDKGKLDSEGNGTASCPAPQGNARFAGMSQVVTRTSVMEAGSGRTTQKTFRANVHPDSFYLGLKSSSTKLKDGETAVIKGLFVDHSGNVINSNSEVEIQFLTVKIEYNWLYDNSSERYSLKRRMHLQFESKTKLKANAGRFEFPFVAPSNAPMYLVRVQSGNSRSELEIEGTGSGWSWYDEWDNESGSTSAPARATPLKIKTTADISEGKPAAVKVAFPYKGWALFTVETDKVIRSEWKEIKEAGTAEWNFTVNEFYPNVYVSALLVKDPHQESAKSYIPERAFGVTSVRMSPAKYSAELKMNSPSEVRPLSQLNVTLDLNNGDSESFVTLAAVDEGILQLTGFETPDPLKQLLQQRGLGVETFETIGWNILVPSQDTLSKTGGDTNSGQSNNAPRPVKPVALWSGLLPVDKSGRVTVKLKVPLFRGELRLMAVAVGKNKIATASGKVKVTEPVVIQTTGPRFLTQGDVAQIPVLLTNTTSTDRRVEVSAVARNFDVGNGDSAFSGGSQKPVSIVGPSSVSLNVPKKSSKVASFQIKANVPLGGAKLTITATSGEEKTTDEVEFPLQSPEALSRTRTIVSVKSSSNTLDYPNFESGTERATVLLTGNPWSPVVAELLPELMQYPYGCIEQTTSKLRPLVYLSELVGDLDPKILKSDRIPKFVDAGIQRILSMQTGTGGFAYWPGMNEPNLFGTVFATHVLLDAQKAGYAVPENRLRSALRFISERLTNSFSRTPPQEAFSIQGYGWHIEP
ncbi:MAG: hypothetical protein EBR09_02965 [Proteobacteria bacterium]|nr:hypothetical protein [Pseudomonadota bacterium]